MTHPTKCENSPSLLAPLPDAELAARIAKAQRRKERTTGKLRMKLK